MSCICKFSVAIFNNKKTSEANFNDILFNPMDHKLSLKHVINLNLLRISLILKIIYIYTCICTDDAKTWNLVCIFYQEHISICTNHILCIL